MRRLSGNICRGSVWSLMGSNRRMSLLSDALTKVAGLQPERKRRVHWSSLVRHGRHNSGSISSINRSISRSWPRRSQGSMSLSKNAFSKPRVKHARDSSSGMASFTFGQKSQNKLVPALQLINVEVLCHRKLLLSRMACKSACTPDADPHVRWREAILPATRLDLDRFIKWLRAPSGRARNENPTRRQSDEPRQESEVNRRQRY